MGHRAEVDLDECAELPAVGVGEDHHRVGCERSFFAGVGEWLACVALAAVLLQLESGRVGFGGERDVEAGERGGVCKEDGVWLLALSAAGCGVASHQAVRVAGWPVVVRCGAAFSVWPCASGEAEVV